MSRQVLSSAPTMTFSKNSGPAPQIITVAATLCLAVSTMWPASARAEERLRTLMEFAGSAIDVATDEIALPEVRFVSNEQMQLDFFGASVVAKRDANRVSLPMISAYFDDRDGVVVLNQDVDYALPENEYILVHELVHYLQWQQGMHLQVRCLQQLETAAYRAQNLWVEATGYGETTDAVTILWSSECPRLRPRIPR